jgi:hypothetical protein
VLSFEKIDDSGADFEYRYMKMDESQVKDFRNSLGQKEKLMFDKREEDLELMILEAIDK